MADRLPVANIQQPESKQIVNLNYLDREAALFKESKNTMKTSSEEINNAIEDNTKAEVREVEEAIQRLNKKVEQIMKTEYVSERQKKIEQAQNQMMKSMKEASDTFFKLRKLIQAKENLSYQEKKQYEDKLFNKILDKFLTEEEKNLFTKIISAGPLLMLGGRGGASMRPGSGLSMLGF